MTICEMKMMRIVAVLCLGFAFANVCQAIEKPLSNDDNSKKLAVQLIGVGTIAGTAKDGSGLHEELVPAVGTTDDEIPAGRKFYNDMFGGISAIAWTGTDNLYWMLPDRGPLDGAVDWTCRVEKVRIKIDANGQTPVEIVPVETIMLKNRGGIPFTGLASAYQATEKHSRRLDPEGIRVRRNGNLLISDEYGPRIIEFTAGGKFVRELDVAKRYLVSNPGVSHSTENTLNESGRSTNRGMEGLAIADDGEHLVGLMQSPLLQDSYRSKRSDYPAGINCRMPVMDTTGDCICEYLYQLDNPKNKLNEILSCDNDQFVVIERDGKIGESAKFKKLMLISSAHATNIQDVDQLPHFRVPEGALPMHKEVLIDLLDPSLGLAGSEMPEKIEGLAFGPDIDNQRRLLLVVSDNDFVPEQKTMVYAFAIPKSKLASAETRLTDAN